MQTICDTARVFIIVILPKRVSLLADQLSKILLIFSIFSIKLELRDLSSKVKNHSPKAKTFSFAQVIGLLEGKVRLELLEAPIQRTSVFSQLTFNPIWKQKHQVSTQTSKRRTWSHPKSQSCHLHIVITYTQYEKSLFHGSHYLSLLYYLVFQCIK